MINVDSKPEVSVLVPYFNSVKTIKPLIDSIKKQEYYQFECFLIDDGSSDNSFDLINELIQSDSRFKNIKRPFNYKAGGRGSKNFAFSLSSGNYIVFFDSDDVMLPQYLSLRVKYLEENLHKNAVISHYYWKVERGAAHKRTFTYNKKVFQNFTSSVRSEEFWLNYLDYRFFYPPGNPMYRRSFIEDKPMWDETTSIGEDHEYHARLFLSGLNLGLIDESTFDYVANPDSMIANSEQIRPLLSRSYGKMLVVENLISHFNTNPKLVQKELVCQVKILRRIVACVSDLAAKEEAIQIMISRINKLLNLSNNSKSKIRFKIFLLRLLTRFHNFSGKGFSIYTKLFKDRNPTFDNVYFTIQ